MQVNYWHIACRKRVRDEKKHQSLEKKTFQKFIFFTKNVTGQSERVGWKSTTGKSGGHGRAVVFLTNLGHSYPGRVDFNFHSSRSKLTRPESMR